MATVPQNLKDVNCVKKSYILLLSPNGSCWQCERSLPPEPCVALTGKEPAYREFYYLLCSITCAEAVIEELSPLSPKLRILTAFSLSALIQTNGSPVAVIEGWRGANHPWYLVYEASDNLESN